MSNKPNRTMLALAGAAFVFVSGIGIAQNDAGATLHQISEVLAVETAGAKADLQGVVVETFYERVVVLRDATGLIIIRTPDGTTLPHMNRGDLITASGTVNVGKSFRPVIESSDITVVSKARSRVAETRLKDIISISQNAKVGDVVTVVGVVDDQRGSSLSIKDSSGRIWIDLGDRFRDRYIPVGTQVAAIGEVVEGPYLVGKVLNVLGIADSEDLRGLQLEATTNDKAEDLKKALHRGAKAGEEIVAKGRIMKFAGDNVRDILYDGNDRLVIEYSEGATSQLESGEEVIVKGTLDFISYKGNTVPVLRKAVVTRDSGERLKPKK